MKNQNSIINPAEAKAKADKMKSIATRIEELLNNVSKEIEKIDNVETNMYIGKGNPRELREQLDEVRNKFHITYEQVTKSANDIITIANTMELQ